MQFIKASERLPEVGKMKFMRAKGWGMFIGVNSIVDGKIHEASSLNPLEYDYEFIEWLDDERIDPGFVDYMNNAKGEFVAFINKQDWNNELRTNAESFIIAYDQIAERLVKAVG